MTAPCAACQVTLPTVRSVVERADALADAVDRLLRDFVALASQAGHTKRQCHSCEDTYRLATDALAAYRAGPPPAYTTDDGRPMCPSCFWKAHSA